MSNCPQRLRKRNTLGVALSRALRSIRATFALFRPRGSIRARFAPYFAHGAQYGLALRPISPYRAQYGLWVALFRPIGLNTGSAAARHDMARSPLAIYGEGVADRPGVRSIGLQREVKRAGGEVKSPRERSKSTKTKKGQN